MTREQKLEQYIVERNRRTNQTWHVIARYDTFSQIDIVNEHDMRVRVYYRHTYQYWYAIA
jgi:hypothetical protein